MPKIKQIHGQQVGADLIVMKRKKGWKATKIMSGETTLRTILYLISESSTFSATQFSEERVAQLLCDITHSRDGAIRIYAGVNKGYTVSYAEVIQSWIQLNHAGTVSQQGYAEGLLLGAFFKSSGLINLSGDYKSSVAHNHNDVVPCFTDCLAYAAIDQVIESARRFFEDKVRDAAQIKSMSTVAAAISFARCFIEFWDDLIDSYERAVDMLNRYTPHLMAVAWHALNDENFIPKVVSPTSIQQILRLGNLVQEVLYNGAGNNQLEYQENWALSLLQDVYTSASREDGLLEIVDSKSMLKDAINIIDIPNSRGEEGLFRIIRDSRPKVFEVQIGRCRSSRASGLYFVENSDISGKCGSLVNETLSIFSAQRAWEIMRSIQTGPTVDYLNMTVNTPSLTRILQVGVLSVAKEVEVRAGGPLTFTVVPTPQTYKKIYGVDLIRGSEQKVHSYERALAVSLNEIAPDRDLIKHQLPTYNLTRDESLSVAATALSSVPDAEVYILDYSGKLHRRRLTLEFALGVSAPFALTQIQNQYLDEEVGICATQWAEVIAHANNFGTEMNEILRELLVMSKNYFGSVTPSMIQQNTSFIPREEIQTREMRCYDAANNLTVMSAVLGIINPDLSVLYNSVLSAATGIHQIYNLVD